MRSAKAKEMALLSHQFLLPDHMLDKLAERGLGFETIDDFRCFVNKEVLWAAEREIFEVINDFAAKTGANRIVQLAQEPPPREKQALMQAKRRNVLQRSRKLPFLCSNGREQKAPSRWDRHQVNYRKLDKFCVEIWRSG